MTIFNQNNSNGNDKLLTTNQTAEYLGVGKETLSVWRATKRYNITYIKVGKLIKYRKSDLDRWLDERTCGVIVNN